MVKIVNICKTEEKEMSQHTRAFHEKRRISKNCAEPFQLAVEVPVKRYIVLFIDRIAC